MANWQKRKRKSIDKKEKAQREHLEKIKIRRVQRTEQLINLKRKDTNTGI
ncbi:hypothetical protein SynWH8103_00534 [Synechococcus sp. WH 8103]|nr:hypothetical protein SynWH8103_00534 [Synechococcus sp. WH 8103]